MKRILAVVIALALMLCIFVACDDSKTSETPGTSSNDKITEAPTKTPDKEQEPTEAPTEKPQPTEAPTENPAPRPTEKPESRPTEKPAPRPTEAPTTLPTESNTEISTDVDFETADEAFLAANAMLADSRYMTIDISSVATSNVAGMGSSTEETVQKLTFAGDNYKDEMTSSDYQIVQIMVGGVRYTMSVDDITGTVKEKTVIGEDVQAMSVEIMRNAYGYEGEMDIFRKLDVVQNGDGSTTYIFSEPTEEATEEMFGMVGDMSIEITLDDQGRFKSVITTFEMDMEVVGMTVHSTSITTCDYTYYAEGELEITAPDDADEYEEVVEEEWSCDCGAESWLDCVCPEEWSCDCGADSYANCVCEDKWVCDCGAESWYDCVCPEEWYCDCGADSYANCVCEDKWVCDCGAETWFDCICE